MESGLLRPRAHGPVLQGVELAWDKTAKTEATRNGTDPLDRKIQEIGSLAIGWTKQCRSLE